MAYIGNKELPWNGAGATKIGQYGSFDEAFQNSPLNYEVAQRPCHIYDLNNKPKKIPDLKVNVRVDNGEVMGVASNKYKMIQNYDAFHDSIEAFRSQMPLEFTSCGVIHGGESAWMVLTSEEYEVMGEAYRTAFIWSNSFNNRSGVKTTFAPFRQVCQNGLHVSVNYARRFWNFRHTGDMNAKMADVISATQEYNKYLMMFRTMMKKLSGINVSLGAFMGQIFPMPVDTTPQQATAIQMMRDQLQKAYNEPNLADMPPNGYRMLQACADVDTHFSIKHTKAVQENKISNIAIQNRPTLLQKSYDLLVEFM